MVVYLLSSLKRPHTKFLIHLIPVSWESAKSLPTAKRGEPFSDLSFLRFIAVQWDRLLGSIIFVFVQLKCHWFNKSKLLFYFVFNTLSSSLISLPRTQTVSPVNTWSSSNQSRKWGVTLWALPLSLSLLMGYGLLLRAETASYSSEKPLPW